jgi:hypothetical protein
MTNQVMVNVIDLYTIEDLEFECKVIIQALLSGLVNCALVTSFIQVGLGSKFSGSDSLMPPTIVKLSNPADFEIIENHHYTLAIHFVYGDSLDKAVFTIEEKAD